MSFQNVRRRRPCILEIGDELIPDLAALFSGSIRLEVNLKIWLLCPLRGERLALTADELERLAQLPAEQWTAVEALQQAGCTQPQIEALAARGLITTDAERGPLRELRDQEERLHAMGWHGLAAVYHARTRWSGIRGDEGSRDHSEEAHLARLAETVEKHGLPPPHLPEHDAGLPRVPLPAPAARGPLWDVLRSRTTTRAFRTREWLKLDALSDVLKASFAPLGQRALGPGLVALRRASPSGGGLHPIEAYVLAVRVDGLAPGLYHYEGAAHRLAQLRSFDEAQARRHIEDFTIGQTFFAEAHALVFHVARAHRNFWKYRRHPKAYKVLFTDAGHLSQTFYLAAASLGLGAFYTGAVNDADVCEWLGLDALTHVVIGANGLGEMDPERNELHLRPQPMP